MTKKLTDELEITIRDEFVHGYLNEEGARAYPSIDGLVSRHGIARATLYQRAKDENWQAQKNRYQTELRTKIDEERMERAVENAKTLDDTCMQLAQAMLNGVGRRLQKAIEEERSDTEYMGLEAHILSHLSTTTANAQKIGKLALGQAQEISKVAADVSNPESFRQIMEQLDELAEARTQEYSDPLH
tara:strand:+ start:1567 stop:2127 length:561 start_codon:yes stop_codon:yes gene_type:complete